MGFRSTRGLLLVSLGLGVTLSCSAGESDNVRDDAGAAGTVVTPSAGAPASSAGAGVGGAAHGGASTGGATTGGAGAGLSGGAGVTGGGSSAGGAGGGASAGAAGTSGAGVGGAASGAGGGGASGAGAGGVSGSGVGGGGASGAGAGGGGASGAGAGGGGASGAGAGGGGASGAGAGGGGASGAGAGGGGASGAGAGGGGGSGGAGSVGTSYTLDKFVINGQPASTISGSAKVTWSATKIQFFFNIKDATPFDDSANNWEDDAVEIYLDMNHAKSAAYQADDVQIIVPRAAGALLSGIGTVTFASITVVRAEVTGGYTLDVSVPWAALNNSGSQLGKTIGIDIGVDDDLNGGTRDAQLMLVGTDQAYQNTSFFADLTLN